MKVSFLEIQEILNKSKIKHEIFGNLNLEFDKFIDLKESKSNDRFITFTFIKTEGTMNLNICDMLTNKKCLLVTNSRIEGVDNQIVVKNSKYIYHYLRDLFLSDNEEKFSIDETALVKCNIESEKLVAIGAYSIIEPNVSIGKNVRIGAHVHINEGTIIEDNVIIDDNIKIGFDAFSFYEINGKKRKVASIGNVIIKSNVFVGNNCVIDKGIDTDTIIGENTVIDSFSSIEHDVKIGKNNVITAGVRITGFVTIGDNNYFGANSCVRNQTTIGNNNLFGMGSVIVKDFENDITAYGNPAKEKKETR